jgi:hypothetical protein
VVWKLDIENAVHLDQPGGIVFEDEDDAGHKSDMMIVADARR